MSYDDWRVNGNWHTCICGAEWSDSDGGSCHYECEYCGEMCDSEEVCKCDAAQAAQWEEDYDNEVNRHKETKAKLAAAIEQAARYRAALESIRDQANRGDMHLAIATAAESALAEKATNDL